MIEYNFDKIRITPLYIPQEPTADVLMFTDIDECQVDNGNCREVCNNTLGSFVCDCRAGFTLQPDGVTCGGTARA